MAKWLIIGGGPDAENWRDYDINPDHIGTSNRGLTWCKDPDFYWCTDPLAVERYEHLWSEYDGEIISNDLNGLYAAHERKVTRWPYLNAGIVYHGRSSGICACRVALERGATELHLVGFNGHLSSDTIKDVNDKPWLPYGENAKARNAAMAKSFADMAENYKNVDFVFHGDTRIKLPLEQPNFRQEKAVDTDE